jgi:hypothetical protein
MSDTILLNSNMNDGSNRMRGRGSRGPIRDKGAIASHDTKGNITKGGSGIVPGIVMDNLNLPGHERCVIVHQDYYKSEW